MVAPGAWPAHRHVATLHVIQLGFIRRVTTRGRESYEYLRQQNPSSNRPAFPICPPDAVARHVSAACRRFDRDFTPDHVSKSDPHRVSF
jgi:hypothetical protein